MVSPSLFITKIKTILFLHRHCITMQDQMLIWYIMKKIKGKWIVTYKGSNPNIIN